MKNLTRFNPLRAALAIVAAGPAAAFVPSAKAAVVIAQYDMASAAASTVADGVTASNLTWASLGAPQFTNNGSPANFNPGSTQFVTSGPETPTVSQGGSDGQYFSGGYGTSVAGTRYLQFSVTVASSLPLESLSLDFARNGNSGARGFEVRYSFDGFETEDTLGGGGLSAGNLAFANFAFDLTGIEDFQDASGTITFRILGYVPQNNNNVAFDNVTLTAIPEPSSLALLSLGALGLAARRRRA